MSTDLQTYYNQDTCSLRIDTCACLAEPLTAASGIGAITIIQMITASSELSAFYLELPYHSITLTHQRLSIGAYRIKLPVPRITIWSVIARSDDCGSRRP